MSKLGVIGGSGIYDLGELRDRNSVEVDTPFGAPSSQLLQGRIGQTEVLFLARHGMGHVYSPSDVPYRANIHALKQLGATHVLSLSAVGSLREALPPRTLVIPDQIIDRTVLRERTFFDRGVVAHVGLAEPFCSLLQEAIEAAAGKAGRPAERGGTYICIEGPQFSTRAESMLYRRWDAAVIGMTVMPEARLAREAELCYATLAMVTDYDVWNESEADVSVEIVLSNLQANGEAAGAVVTAIAQAGLPSRTCRCAVALDHAVVTAPNKASHEARSRTELLTARQERQD